MYHVKSLDSKEEDSHLPVVRHTTDAGPPLFNTSSISSPTSFSLPLFLFRANLGKGYLTIILQISFLRSPPPVAISLDPTLVLISSQECCLIWSKSSSDLSAAADIGFPAPAAPLAAVVVLDVSFGELHSSRVLKLFPTVRSPKAVEQNPVAYKSLNPLFPSESFGVWRNS